MGTRKVKLLAASMLLLAASGCGETAEDAEAAPTMPDVVGMQLDLAVADIESAGFEEDVDVASTGTFGVIDESNWTVCEQSPTAGEALDATPELTVDRSCGNDDADGATEPAPDTTPPPTAASAPEPPDEVLTPEISPELAAILGEGDYCSDAVQAFATTNAGRTIRFDGHVASLANHGSYDTRYDILVGVGGFGGPSAAGPAFQFRDVGIADLDLTGPNIPPTVEVGLNIGVTATVGEYEEASCLFLLDPVTTEVR